MRPIKFPEQTVVYAEHQENYLPLPAHKTEDGEVTSCWQMNWKERIKTFFTGKIYVTILTFNDLLQPQIVKVDPPKE